MAISVVQKPINFHRVGGEAIYVCTSTNVTEQGFKFIVEIEVDSSVIYKGYHDPNPNGRLVFNARKILETVVKTDTRAHTGEVIHRPSNAFSRCVNGSKGYKIMFGEAYVDSGLFTEFTDLEDEELVCVQGFHDGREIYNITGYPLSAFRSDTQTRQQARPFLTGRIWDRTLVENAATNVHSLNIVNPEVSDFETSVKQLVPVIDVYDTDDGVLSMYNFPKEVFSSIGVTERMVVKIFSGASLLNTYTFDLLTSLGTRPPTATENDGRICHFAAYPNSNLLSVFLTINPTWTSYTVQPFNISESEETGQYVRFRRIKKKCKNTAKRIAWANRFGGYDYFWFEGSTEFRLDADKKTFMKARGNYSTSSTFTILPGDASKENYYNDIERGWKVFHGTTSREERVLLEGLFTSKTVWIFDKEWLPCLIENVNYTRVDKTSRSQGVEFDVKLAYNANA